MKSTLLRFCHASYMAKCRMAHHDPRIWIASLKVGLRLMRTIAIEIAILLCIYTSVSPTCAISLSSRGRRGEEADRAKCGVKNPKSSSFWACGNFELRCWLLDRVLCESDWTDVSELRIAGSRSGTPWPTVAHRAAAGGILRGKIEVDRISFLIYWRLLSLYQAWFFQAFEVLR